MENRDYDKVLGSLDVSKEIGLTEVVLDEKEELVEVLFAGRVRVSLNKEQAEVVRDGLVSTLSK